MSCMGHASCEGHCHADIVILCRKSQPVILILSKIIEDENACLPNLYYTMCLRLFLYFPILTKRFSRTFRNLQEPIKNGPNILGLPYYNLFQRQIDYRTLSPLQGFVSCRPEISKFGPERCNCYRRSSVFFGCNILDEKILFKYFGNDVGQLG